MTDREKINSGLICPYCNKNTEFVDSSCIYGKSYGMIYICKPCNAYVGVHKGTKYGLGRLANKELRELKKEAHKYFDRLWKYGYKTRKQAYTWLANELGINESDTHIGMFDEQQCKKAIEVSKIYLALK